MRFYVKKEASFRPVHNRERHFLYIFLIFTILCYASLYFTIYRSFHLYSKFFGPNPIGSNSFSVKISYSSLLEGRII